MTTPQSELITACEALLKQFKEERPESVWPDYPIIEQTEKALEAIRPKFGNDSRENYSFKIY